VAPKPVKTEYVIEKCFANNIVSCNWWGCSGMHYKNLEGKDLRFRTSFGSYSKLYLLLIPMVTKILEPLMIAPSNM